jgi:hypothetical protein
LVYLASLIALLVLTKSAKHSRKYYNHDCTSQEKTGIIGDCKIRAGDKSANGMSAAATKSTTNPRRDDCRAAVLVRTYIIIIIIIIQRSIR